MKEEEKIIKSSPGCIMICYPTRGSDVGQGENKRKMGMFTSDFMLSQLILGKPLNVPIRYCFSIGKAVEEARNDFVEVGRLPENNASYLFMVDDDVIMPGNALLQLYFRMRSSPIKPDVVSGLFTTKSDPPEPIVYRGSWNGVFWDFKMGDYFEITGSHLGCTLIDMKIFDKIEPPYFAFTMAQEKKAFGDAVNVLRSEDISFCHKVREAGGILAIDTAINCHHWDGSKGLYYFLPRDSKPYALKVGVTEFRLPEDLR